MKNRFLLIALLLAICQFQSGILYGQLLTPVDTSGVWYTDKQDVKCLICLVNEPKKDSIIMEQSNFIQFQDTTINKLTDLNATKTKRNKRNSYIFGGGGFGLGVFFTWLLLK